MTRVALIIAVTERPGVEKARDARPMKRLGTR